MQFEYISMAFIILSSLIGTLFIVKTIYELFLHDDYKGEGHIKLTYQNEIETEYIVRTALETAKGMITVHYCGSNMEVMEIIRRLSRESGRLIVHECL